MLHVQQPHKHVLARILRFHDVQHVDIDCNWVFFLCFSGFLFLFFFCPSAWTGVGWSGLIVIVLHQAGTVFLGFVLRCFILLK